MLILNTFFQRFLKKNRYKNIIIKIVWAPKGRQFALQE